MYNSPFFLQTQWDKFVNNKNTMSTPGKIGILIKRLRQNRGLSQEQLSHFCNVDQHYLSNIENGQRNPSVEMVERIANYFGYALSRFFIEVETLEDTPDQAPDPIVHGNGREGFMTYMQDRNLSSATITKYCDNVPNCVGVKNAILEVTNITDDMYHVKDVDAITSIIDIVRQQQFDQVGQRMYSCGLKKYRDYIRSLE